MSTRIDKVNSVVAAELNSALGRHFSGGSRFATVTAVETSPDLRHAKCYVAVIPDDDESWTLAAAAAPDLQQHLAERLEMKRTPVISLKRDRGAQNVATVARILER